MNFFALVAILACVATALDPSSGWRIVKDGSTPVDACIAAGGDTWNAFAAVLINNALDSETRPTFLDIIGIPTCQKGKILAQYDLNAYTIVEDGFTKATVPNALVCCSSRNCVVPAVDLAEIIPAHEPGSWRISLVGGVAADSDGINYPLKLSVFSSTVPECAEVYAYGGDEGEDSCSATDVTIQGACTPLVPVNQVIYITDTSSNANIYDIIVHNEATYSIAADSALVSVTDPAGATTYFKLSDVVTALSPNTAGNAWGVARITIGTGLATVGTIICPTNECG